MGNLIVYIKKNGMKYKLFKINYILIFFIFSFHLPKVHCQESESQNQSFRASVTIPFFIQTTHTVKTLKGKPQPDKITKKTDVSIRYSIKTNTIKAEISNNRITAHYENSDGKEKINFSGTISKDKKMLLKLGINYSYIGKGDNPEVRKGKFYIYNVPLKKMDKMYKDLYRMDNIAENEEIFTGKYEVGTTKIEVESYHYFKNSAAIFTYVSETETETLIGDDPDSFKKVLPFGWRITFTSSEENEPQGIVIKGNSTSYAGYVIAGLLKDQEIQIFDQTDEVNKAREVEASMKDICNPNHRDMAIRTEENLKQPLEGQTTVTINETHNVSPQGINTVILIQGQKRSKELKYSLNFGESDSDLIECDEMFFSQIEEIIQNIIQMN